MYSALKTKHKNKTFNLQILARKILSTYPHAQHFLLASLSAMNRYSRHDDNVHFSVSQNVTSYLPSCNLGSKACNCLRHLCVFFSIKPLHCRCSPKYSLPHHRYSHTGKARHISSHRGLEQTARDISGVLLWAEQSSGAKAFQPGPFSIHFSPGARAGSACGSGQKTSQTRARAAVGACAGRAWRRKALPQPARETQK